MTSIVITQHEEDAAFVQECIDQIRATIDIKDYEIIIVDDCSAIPLVLGNEYNDIKIIRNRENVGVGQSFDAGVKIAKGEDLIIMACDIRFINNGWASRLLMEIQEHPRSIVCTGCVTLYQDDAIFDDNTTKRIGYGATILMYHDNISNPSKQNGFRSIIDAKWEASKPEESYDIPCVLGAIYAVKKEWYNHLDGFWGHRQWGTLEPYLSLKSWLFGGSCRIVKTIKTGHIFSRNIHNVSLVSVAYNKLLVATLLFDATDRGRLIQFLNDTNDVRRALRIFGDNIEGIEAKRSDVRSKIICSVDDFCDKFKIDMRKDNNIVVNI